jgi:tRNA threonylcarbamoyladenosine biosynthesis protein TsaB
VVILAFDTATAATTVALCSPGTAVEARDDPPPGQRPGHVSRLMPLIVDVMSSARIGWNDVDRIAVGVGPGTFTGLRIGIATARGLAYATGIPLVGTSTLRSLALNLEGTVAAVLDARRGEVFAAVWRAPDQPVLPPAALAPAKLAKAIEELDEPVLAIGPGAIEFRQVLERAGASIPDDSSELHRVTAINHCRLARELPAGAPDKVLPDYLRLPDAEIARRARPDQQ